MVFFIFRLYHQQFILAFVRRIKAIEGSEFIHQQHFRIVGCQKSITGCSLTAAQLYPAGLCSPTIDSRNLSNPPTACGFPSPSCAHVPVFHSPCSFQARKLICVLCNTERWGQQSECWNTIYASSFSPNTSSSLSVISEISLPLMITHRK